MAKRDRETAPLLLRRTGSGFAPASSFDAEMMDDIAMGSEVEVQIKQRRSRKMHKAYWAAAARVVDNVEGYPTTTHLHEATKMELGYCQRLRLMDGTIAYVPDSTAFSAMSQQEFRTFMDRAVKLWIETFGFDPLAERSAA